MRNVIVLGGSLTQGLAVRLAAELAAHANDVNVILVEGEEHARAVAETLKASDASSSDETLRAEDLLVIGAGFGGLSRELMFSMERFECEVPTLDFIHPRQQHVPYWQQGNQAFDRKQQAMRAKARRR